MSTTAKIITGLVIAGVLALVYFKGIKPAMDKKKADKVAADAKAKADALVAAVK